MFLPLEHLTKGQRFYDTDPGCRYIIEHISLIEHIQVQEFCAGLLHQVAEGILHILKNQGGSNLKSLGLASVKNKYMSRRFHRRWYDGNKTLSEAFEFLYILPPEGLTALCFKVNEIFALIALYSYICNEAHHPPDIQELMAISRSGMFTSFEAAQDLVKDFVGPDIYQKFSDKFRELIATGVESSPYPYPAF